MELKSAHREIETLLTEITNLKKLNESLLKKNDMYKSITNSPIKQKLIKPISPNTMNKDKHTQTTPIRRTPTEAKPNSEATQQPQIINIILNEKVQHSEMQTTDNSRVFATKAQNLCIKYK